MSALLFMTACAAGFTVNNNGFSPNLLGFQGLNPPLFVLSSNSINFPIRYGYSSTTTSTSVLG